MRMIYDLEGMRCGSCVLKIQSAIGAVEHVSSADVSLNPPRAVVEVDRDVPLAVLQSAITKVGSYYVREQLTNANPSLASEADEGYVSGQSAESLYPLFLIVGYILGVVLFVAYAGQEWSVGTLMRHFMAGFFLVFSFFKLLDLRGFVDAFRGYDLIAKVSLPFAWAYPFIELVLGIAFLLNAWTTMANVVTLILMTIGAAGVLRALFSKRAIRCACLGTALNLPMTKVTLVEDVAMALMAAVMLLIS